MNRHDYKVYVCLIMPQLKTNQVFWLGFDKSGEIPTWYAEECFAHVYTKCISHEEIRKEIQETFPELKEQIYFQNVIGE